MTKEQYLKRLRKIETRQLKQEFFERILASGLKGVRINEDTFYAELDRRIAIRFNQRDVIEKLLRCD